MALRNGSRTLPTIRSHAQLQQYMGTWQHRLTRVLQRPLAPNVPRNFRITNARGGFRLEWGYVTGADGYELQRSDDGNFTTNVVTIPLRHVNSTSYFDPVGGAPTTKYYRVLATSGTENAPHSVIGPASAVISHTSIDANDTVSSPSTKYDDATTDQSSVGTAGSGVGGSGSNDSGEGGTGGGYGNKAIRYRSQL